MSDYKVGDIVVLKAPVWDADTDNAYPPGYIGRAGDRLRIVAINPAFTYPLSVRHLDLTEGSFGVTYDEVKADDQD